MSSTKSDLRFRNLHTSARSSPPRSRLRDCLPGSERLEPERLSRPENQQRYETSNHEDNASELCMKKLSEFNESLRRQEQLATTKFQWSFLLPDNPGTMAAATNPVLTMQNDTTATAYSMSPIGIGLTEENRFIDSRPLHLMEMKLGFVNNGEGFRYLEVGNGGMISDAVGFGGYGEILDSDPLSVISEKARKRIRRTEEVTELAYRKMESVRARATAINSVVDKIDGAGDIRALELERRISLPQQYMTDQTSELLRGERHQQREDCSHHDQTQRYLVFSREGEGVVGFRMNHSCSPKVALFHCERQRLEELDCGHVLPQLYSNAKEKPHRNENEQKYEVLGCCMNRGQSQNGEVFHGESQQFQHYVHFGRKSHDDKEQGNEDFHSKMNCHQSPKGAPLLGELQELSDDFGHAFPQNFVDFGRESHLMEQTNDVFSSGMNLPQGQKMALFKGEKLELSGDYDHSLPQHYLDFNVEPGETVQEDELLGSRMNHLLEHRWEEHGYN